jgi:uncharacterized RDD family membrane protein YckC
MQINPYESPAAELCDEIPVDKPLLVSSGMRQRIVAAMLDNFGALLLCYFVALLLAQFNEVLAGIAMVVLYLAYYFAFEGWLAATPGKFYMRLRVCNLEGRRCGWRQAGLRTLFRLLELNPLVCGAIPAWIVAMCTSRKQRLGDLVAGTLVVHASQIEDD